MSKSKATLSYVSALVIYGTLGWVLSFIDVPSEVIALGRAAFGSLFILIMLCATKRGFNGAMVRANLGWLALSGLSLGLNWVLLFAAYRATTVAVASLCNYMAPVILIVVAPIVLQETLSIEKALCAGVAVFGMLLLSGVLSGGAEGVTGTGVMLGLAAAVAFVVMVLGNKKMSPMPVLEKAAVQLVFAMVATVPFVLMRNWGMALHTDGLSLVLMLVIGLVHTGFAYCLYFGALEHLKAQTIAVLGYVEPAVSVLCSAFLLHEPLSLLGWLGAALIIGAAAVSEIVK